MIDRQELHAYADEQLGKVDKQRVRAAIDADPKLQAELQQIFDIKSLLAIKAESHSCDVTWSKCMGRLNELDKSRRIESFVGRYSWGLCGVIFASILIGGVMSRQSGGVRTDDVARYASILQPAGPAKSSQDSQDLRQLKEALSGPNGSVDYSQLQIREAVESWQGGQHVMALKIADGKGTLGLMQVAGSHPGEGMEPIAGTKFHAGMVGRQNCVAWEQRGHLMVLIGPRTYDELVQIAERYCCK
jgi:hypothetical protein